LKGRIQDIKNRIKNKLERKSENKTDLDEYDYNKKMIENEKKKLKNVQGYYVGDSSYALV